MISDRLCMGCMKDRGEQEKCPHCGWVEGTMPESPQHLPPGTVLNEKYLIGRVLGQGGFGITYLAWDINLNIKLAVKEYMPQDLASRAAGHSMVSAYTGALNDQFEYGLEKFLQEARTLAQFEGHPNIVSVRDFFRANGTAYLVMHYIEGVTLKGYVAQEGGLLPVNTALRIIFPVLDALKEVHTVDILHRDISPDNIFINMKGQVILIDFGAARQAIGEKGRSLSIIMKPGFTPEEQYRSKGIQGPWTDIYAVAATLYRVITGLMPPESLDRLEEDHLVPPSTLGIEITEGVEQALLKALAVRAPDRFQSVKAFQEALLEGSKMETDFGQPLTTAPSFNGPSVSMPSSSQVSGGPSGAPALPGTAGVPIPSQSKGRGIHFIAAGAVAVLFLVGTGIYFLGSAQPGKPPSPAPQGVENTAETWEDHDDGIPVEDRDLQFGTFAYEGGEYTGQHHEEKPQGEGAWKGESGEKYEGFWVEGLPHGEGTWIGPDGQRYEGEWQAGKKNGYGTYVSANRVQYVGNWKNDMRNGYGTETWPNGSSYVGEWKDDLRHGHGTYIWPNGAQYVGDWHDGWQHGEGTLTHADGTVQSGTWVNNELQSR